MLRRKARETFRCEVYPPPAGVRFGTPQRLDVSVTKRMGVFHQPLNNA